MEILSKKGFNAFREMCTALELECPHLLTSLLLDSTGKNGSFISNLSSRFSRTNLHSVEFKLPVYGFRFRVGLKLTSFT